ncbi:hypothetical protein NAT51_11845 [Flavobacterium amniphilum]|uniref:hypothetical protein n=1 Tax=Flavobacterium amniphilum TaxID=1834035 RepID=UPI00202A4449|nr:hypothetical protein [Flavobacterium amniphilum]MCL9806219.1 hypothetical protein [Flavobacterium amniphilum]
MAKEPFAVKLTCIWTGGFFFWVLKGFKGKLIDQLADGYESRNAWTGYFISLLFAGTVVYLVVRNNVRF